MLYFQRFIFSALLVLSLLLTACPAQISSIPLIAITPDSIAAPTSTSTPAGIPTPSPTPAVSIPSFASFQPVTRVSLSESEHVLNMVADSDDTIWLLTDQRVLQYGQGAWIDYLSQFSGTIIDMDFTHRVWVVSDDHAQVSVWDGSMWTNFGSEAGWEPPIFDNGMELDWSLTTDALGQVWLATDRDVRMFDGAKWKVFDFNDLGIPLPDQEDTLSETNIVFLKISGYLFAINCDWIGPGPIGGGGARWYDGHVWHGSDSPVAHGCATVVKEDNLGNIWLGLDKDLWRLDANSGDWERFPTPEPPEGGWFGLFSDLALDVAGTPWPELVRCGGASCYTGNIRYHFTGTEWLQIGGIGTDNGYLYFDATGQGWVFRSSSVERVAEDQLEPVADLSILKVAVTPSGKIWIAGIFKGETVLWAQIPDD